MKDVIVIKPIETKEIAERETDAVKTLFRCEAIVIKCQKDYVYAGECLKQVKKKAKDLEIMRLSITKPLNDAKNAVMDLFRKPSNILAAAEGKVKKCMIDYTVEQERILKEKEEKLRRQAEAEEARKRKVLEEQARKQEAKAEELRRKAKEADEKERQRLEEKAKEADERAEQRREKKEEVHIEAPVLDKTVKTPTGVSYREKWYAVVVDKSKLNIQYLEANMSLLNKFAQATKGKINLPGVEFKFERILASRS